MSNARTAMVLIFLLVVLPFTPQIPGCVVAHRSKTGTVVDVATGKGLPDAFVIASARFISDPVFFGPAGNNVLYNVIARTNEQGSFAIPSTWSDIAIGIPWTHARIHWIVTVFEPGYAVVGDEKAWLYEDTYGMPRYLPRSTSIMPKLSITGWLFGNLNTLNMFRPALSLKQAATYYSTVKGASRPMLGSTDSNDLALRRKGYDFLAPWLCSYEQDSNLDYAAAMSLYGFSLDQFGAMELQKTLDPTNRNKELYDRPIYKSQIVCKIITNGTGVP